MQVIAPPQALGTPPPPQMLPPLQLGGPQTTVPPHPSPIDPQFMPCGHCVSLGHAGLPHTFCTPPPPQICPAAHVEPQLRTPPQPSAMKPQFLPAAWHVVA